MKCYKIVLFPLEFHSLLRNNTNLAALEVERTHSGGRESPQMETKLLLGLFSNFKTYKITHIAILRLVLPVSEKGDHDRWLADY